MRLYHCCPPSKATLYQSRSPHSLSILWRCLRCHNWLRVISCVCVCVRVCVCVCQPVPEFRFCRRVSLWECKHLYWVCCYTKYVCVPVQKWGVVSEQCSVKFVCWERLLRMGSLQCASWCITWLRAMAGSDQLRATKAWNGWTSLIMC